MSPLKHSLLLALCIQPLFAGSLQVLAWDDDIAKRKFAIGVGDKSVEVPYMHPSARTQAIEVPEKAANLSLIALDRPDGDGKPFAIPLKISENIKNPLAIIMPNEKSPTGARVIVIDDSQAGFKWGTIRLFNVSNKALAFRWDEKAVQFPPGWKPVDVSPGGKSRNMEVFLYLKEDLKKPLYSSVWEHRSDMRQLVFLVPATDTSRGLVEFKFVNELRLEPASE